MYQLFFFGLLAAIFVTIGIVARLLSRRPMARFGRNLLISFVLVELLLTAAHMLATTGDTSLPAYWRWFFNAQYERNLPTLFSSVQLVLVAVVALVNGLATPRLGLWRRLYWLVVVFIFGFMGVDEFYTIHETWGGYTASDAWEIPYMIAGIIFFLLSALAWWRGFRREFYFFFVMFAGLGILIAGGVIFENIVREGFVEYDASLRWMFIFEELFEMVGATVILSAMLSYASSHLPPRTLGIGRGVIAVGGLIWAAWLLFSLFILPSVEARYLTNSVDVDYDNGRVSLVGYNVQPAIAKPGDLIGVTLYWRANQPLDTDYSVSLHALSQPDITTGAQSDDLHAGPIPSTAWFPGVVVEKTLYLQTPRDLPAPASYWLAVRIWSGPWPLGRPWTDTTGLTVTSAGDLRTLGEDSIILTSLPVLARDPADPAATHTDYTFAEGFRLAGYDLPTEPVQTHTLPVSFNWVTTTRPTRQLTQFFHLTPVGGGDVIAFDQQPFGGSFPTQDWPAEAVLRDEWALELPDTLPEGDYEVRTGLYDVTTLERVAVTDELGQPVPDSSLVLGTITFAPDAAVEAALENAAPTGICYAVSDTNSLNGDERDTIVSVDYTTGETIAIGQTGGIKTEGLTFNADRTLLYGVDEREDVGQFIVIDPETGVATEVGSGLVAPDAPARNPQLGEDMLKDIDSIALEPATGIVWAIQQDEANLLFQIDPQTGTLIRDAFGDGVDFVGIDITSLPGAAFNNVKDMAVDPASGTFYILVGSEDFDSYLARIDFETLDLETGKVSAVPVAQPVSRTNGEAILDMEAMSFTPEGVLYAISSNNSTVPEWHDMLWQLDVATGEATPVDQLSRYVDYVDYEALACLPATAEE